MEEDINQVLGINESTDAIQSVPASNENSVENVPAAERSVPSGNASKPNENYVETSIMRHDGTQGAPTATSSGSNGAENTLNVIAYLVLISGIILSIILLFTICFIDVPNPYDPYEKGEKVFNPQGFGYTVGLFITSLATWALFRVIVNISKSLKEIKNKLKK